MQSEKTFHLGHVPGTVFVDKIELDTLRAEVARLQAELAAMTAASDVYKQARDHALSMWSAAGQELAARDEVIEEARVGVRGCHACLGNGSVRRFADSFPCTECGPMRAVLARLDAQAAGAGE